MKLNRAYTQSLNDSIERIKLLFSDEEKFSRFNFTSKQFTGAIKAKQVKAAIKLLASLGYSVFKFSWIHTTQVDKNAVKVIGYYKLNKA